MSDDFSKLDAVAQADLVRKGEVTSLELVDAALVRIEQLNPTLNAVISVDAELARERANKVAKDTLFAGVPTLLKDLMTYPNFKTEFGSRFFAGQISPNGTPYTDTLDKAGLIVLGKTTTSEFGLLGTTETLLYGATRNPWDMSLSTGGSSGGAVAAVASGIVAVAHASDGGGSIRGSAALCGLFGFKPSRGLTVTNGVPDAIPTAGMLAEHCVSRSVRDSAAWLEATAQVGKLKQLTMSPARLKIGFYTCDSYGNSATAEVKEVILATAKLCLELGHEVQQTTAPKYNADGLAEAFFLLGGAGLVAMLEQVKPLFGVAYNENNLEPFTQCLVAQARRASTEAVAQAIATLAQAEIDANNTFGEFDILLSPTVPFTAFPLAKYNPEQAPDLLISFTKQLAGFTVVASVAGWPAMSVPLYLASNGLPVGSHFMAKQGDDHKLMALAYQLETAKPWAQNWPAVNALMI